LDIKLEMYMKIFFLGTYGAAGMQGMMLSEAWDELLLLPEMDVDKALNAARTAGDYPMPGEE
jgi:hypothetical protein